MFKRYKEGWSTAREKLVFEKKASWYFPRWPIDEAVKKAGLP